MSSEEPDVSLGFVYLGLAILGVFASSMVHILSPGGIRRPTFDIVMAVGPPLAVLGGFVYFSSRAGSFSIASVAAVIGTSLGATLLVLVWFPTLAFFVPPPAFALGSYLIGAAFENPETPVPRRVYEHVFVSSVVLLVAAIIDGGLEYRDDFLRIVVLLILAAVILLWTGRHILSRRKESKA